MQEHESNERDSDAALAVSPVAQKSLRLWPGLALAGVVLLVRYVLPVIAPDREVFSVSLELIAVLGGLVGGFAIFIWWLFLSRAPWIERVGAVGLLVIAVVVTRLFVHESIRGGMMGMMLVLYSIPLLALTLVAWAAATQRLSNQVRRALLVAVILLACAPWTLVRTAGLFGSGSEFHWRWTPTPEQRLLAQTSDEPLPLPSATPAPTATPELLKATPTVQPSVTPSSSPELSTTAKSETVTAAKLPTEWPGFRGPRRDGVIRGVQIKTDWTAAPPVEVWKRPIGPGWSSFAVHGDLLYTQEQRGEDELVGCYKVSTGEPVWRHRDHVRFWESNGGAGPRATPTVSGNRVYAFGATGILNALDAANGKLLWTRNAATETGRKVPDWGFASSPLVVGDVVVVAVSGTLAAYDAATGKPRWTGPAHGGSYSSPHRATINGVTQVVLLHGDGATSVAPADGKLLWEYAWDGSAIVQPSLLADGNLLISTGGAAGGLGTRRLSFAPGPNGWNIEERWTSNGLKPYFNDFVAHKGHAYGFDGNILACINLADGKRKWKGGRYGNGQLVLLADQDLLLVLSEEGELALVNAAPEQFTEVARFKALEGKTWNHPALVGDLLLARNGEQMAAFRLPVAGQ